MALQQKRKSSTFEGHTIGKLPLGNKCSQIDLPGACTDTAAETGREADFKSQEPEPADLSQSQHSHQPANRSFRFRKFSCCSCNPFRSLARRVQLGKSAPSINQLSFFSIAPKGEAMVTPMRGTVADVIGFQLKRYLQDRCVDGKSSLQRFGEISTIVLSLFLVLPMLSFLVCALIPLESPKAGFWSNWSFNLLVHPVLNYVIARGQIEVMARAFGQEDRIRIRWIVRLTPLADVGVCILAHLIASFADVYPIPVSPATVCIPGCWISMALYWQLLPQEILTPQVRSFVKFNFANWASWLSQFVLFAVWTVKFPAMSEHFQALSTLGIGLLVAFCGWMTQKCGDCMGLPRFLRAEVKLCMFFISLFCSATVMSSVKSMRVVFLIAAMDAGKALVVTGQLLWELVQALEEEDGLYGPSEEDPAAAPASQQPREREVAEQPRRCKKLCTEWQKLWLKAEHKLKVASRVGQRLRGVLGRIESGTEKEMHTADICPADARMLNILTHCWANLALIELCELLVPVLYMIMASFLRYVGGNRIYFLQFRHETLTDFQDGIVGNSIAVAIEVVVFLCLQIWLLRMFGINLWEFTGTLIRLDYSFYFFAMSACLVAFLAISTEHFGSWGLMSLVT
ncbi:unnamed protein product [Symbiodinium sp. CCMP2592]|nr:unnamed protein product [Symbiodinium sp. CCMP2592]